MVSKAELRKIFKSNREQVVVNSALGSSLSKNILKVIGSQASVWGSYLPHGSEANPQLTVDHITWAYPKIAGDALEFFIPSFSSDWDLNEYKIREPKSGKKIEISQMSGILIPGVAFDRKGHRLGSGKGYFDRTLKAFNGKKVGVAYLAQISKSDLPAEAHDITMNVIVTESEIIQVSERKAS